MSLAEENAILKKDIERKLEEIQLLKDSVRQLT